jgi:hypothetical protein
MKLSQLREVKELSNELDLDFKELVTAFIDSETDFEIDNYRFISANEIDEVQQNELKSDLYMLGCFNADFLSEHTDLSYKAIVALQKAEAYEELGEIVVDNIEAIQEGYASADGYGHHFNHYDGNEWEINIDGTNYYYFRTN